MRVEKPLPFFKGYIFPVKTVKNNFLNNKKAVNTLKATSENYRANYIPNINFKGNAPMIKQAYIITGEANDIPLLKTKDNGSYIVDFDSQTEIIYGNDAIEFLSKTRVFDYDTQIIFPKKASGTLKTRDGKQINLNENSALMINAGVPAEIMVDKGYPMIILSKKDYDWYERYSCCAKNPAIQDKFSELMFYNSHLYNGEFSPNILLGEDLTDDSYLRKYGIDKWNIKNRVIQDLYEKRNLIPEEDRKKVEAVKELYDKLFAAKILELRDNNYVKFSSLCNEATEKKLLKQKGFSDEEIDYIMPIFSRVRQMKADTLIAIRNCESLYNPELVQKMKERGLLFYNKRKTGFVYWKYLFGDENTLKSVLNEKGFTQDEQQQIIDSWKRGSKSGFDLSGLKFIDEDFALYSMDGKINNWTQGATNWVTNSTSLKSLNESGPFIGVSIVQLDKDEIVDIADIRKEEILHSHPNCGEKRQSEVYLVTSGTAALNVIKDGKSKVQILKEGDLAVLAPGIAHCINSVSGEYEHIVVQIPSAFQYGFAFKQGVTPPWDYGEKALKQLAKTKLEELKV